MTQDNTFAPVVMHEGVISIPPGFEDRTTQLFVPRNTETEPNLSVARDTLHEGETLEKYITRQIGVLKSRLAGHKVVRRESATLGKPDAVLNGEEIDAHYKNGGRIIYQRQAAFLVTPHRALIFSASSASAFDDAFETLWRTWLDSFVAHRAAEPTP